eukprot:PhF_6_TR28492/c0_g1_i1/m.42100
MTDTPPELPKELSLDLTLDTQLAPEKLVELRGQQLCDLIEFSKVLFLQLFNLQRTEKRRLRDRTVSRVRAAANTTTGQAAIQFFGSADSFFDKRVAQSVRATYFRKLWLNAENRSTKRSRERHLLFVEELKRKHEREKQDLIQNARNVLDKTRTESELKHVKGLLDTTDAQEVTLRIYISHEERERRNDLKREFADTTTKLSAMLTSIEWTHQVLLKEETSERGILDDAESSSWEALMEELALVFGADQAHIAHEQHAAAQHIEFTIRIRQMEELILSLYDLTSTALKDSEFGMRTNHADAENLNRSMLTQQFNEFLDNVQQQQNNLSEVESRIREITYEQHTAELQLMEQSLHELISYSKHQQEKQTVAVTQLKSNQINETATVITDLESWSRQCFEENCRDMFTKTLLFQCTERQSLHSNACATQTLQQKLNDIKCINDDLTGKLQKTQAQLQELQVANVSMAQELQKATSDNDIIVQQMKEMSQLLQTEQSTLAANKRTIGKLHDEILMDMESGIRA